MISKIKKPVSILLSVIMVFSLFTIVPITAGAAVDVPVQSVTIMQDGEAVDFFFEMTIGDTTTLSAVVTPEDATDKTVTWSSDNEDVATIDQNGVVTAVSSGGAEITVTATNGTDDTSDDIVEFCFVDVKKTPINYIDADGTEKSTNSYYMVTDSDSKVNWGNAWYVVEGDVTINAKVTAGGSAKLLLCDGATLNINCTSGSALEVQNNFAIYCQREGTGKLNVINTGDYSYAIYSSVKNKNITFNGGTVFAKAYYSGIQSPLSPVTINGGSVTAIGKAWGIYGNVSNKIAGTGWTDTAGTAGQADISVSTTARSISSYKKLQFPASYGVSLTPNSAQTLYVDDTVAFTADFFPKNATDKTVKWSVSGAAVKLYTDEACTTEVGSDATSALTVYAKGESAGSATVTVACNADNTKTATCDLTVKNYVESISISPDSAQTLRDDETVAFSADVSPENATDKTVKWSVSGTAVKLYTDEACTTEVGSEATDILTVYAKGESAGSATVNVTSNADDTKAVSCSVTVEKSVVINVNTDTKYVNIKEAVKQVSAGDTIKLLTDTEVDSNVSISKDLTLDLNGYGLRTKRNPVRCMLDAGSKVTLTLEDSNPTNETGANRPEGVKGGYITDGLGSSPAVTAGTFIMNGGTITGNIGGAVSVGTFIMNGGAITNNSKSQDGAGVNTRTFTMNGGVISGNTTTGNGGGVYASGSTVTITGGEISGNTADGLGGGVYTIYSPHLSGSPIIKDNKSAGKDSNLYLTKDNYSQKKITVDGTLSNAEPIGVSMAEPGVFTTGLNGNGNAFNFTSDSDEFKVVLDGTREAKLVSQDATYVVGIGETEYVSLEDANTAAAAGDTIKVLKDIVVTEKTVINKDVTLDLNGYGITGNMDSGNGVLIIGSKVTLTDSTPDREGGDNRPNGVTGGYIVGGNVPGVYVGSSGRLTMESGTITGSACGVNNENGTFIMNGGAITGNSTTGDGGGVSVTRLGGFAMNGGSITNNSAAGNGGGVCVPSTGAVFNLNGGTISNNTAGGNGGGVYSLGKNLNITGGEITGNTSTGIGGGVYSATNTSVVGTSTISYFMLSGAPVIKDNKSGEKNSNVYLAKNSNGQTTIRISGALTNTDPIGIAMEEPGIFTILLKTSGKADASKFVSEQEDYVVLPSGNEAQLAFHTHSFTYSADGATITATCTTPGCNLTDSKATLTIVKPTLEIYGGTGDANATLDGLNAFNTATGQTVQAADIAYVGRDGTTYEESATAPENVGKYTAKITVGDVTASVDYEIAKLDINPTVTLEGWTYGEDANAPEVTGNDGNGEVTITYAAKGSDEFTADVPENAGEYTVKAAIAETEYYNGGEATADFTIAKATPVLTLSTKTLYYNGKWQQLVQSAALTIGDGIDISDEAKVWYSLEGGLNELDYSPVGKNVGEYEVYTRVEALTENVNAIAYGEEPYCTVKIAAVPTVKMTGYTYGDEEAFPTPEVEGNVGDGEVTYKYYPADGDAADAKVWDDSITELTLDAGDYKMFAEIAESETAVAVTTEAVDFTVGVKTVAEPTIIYTPEENTYNGGEITPAVTVKDGDVVIDASEYTVTYKENINAGTATITVTDNEGGNYTVSGETTFAIKKAELELTLTIEGWTFGEEANAPELTGNAGEGEVTYLYKLTDADDETYTETVPTDAGNYTIKAVVAETDNYLAGEKTADFTIAKAAINPEVTIEDWTYGEQANEPVVTGNIGEGNVVYTYAAIDDYVAFLKSEKTEEEAFAIAEAPTQAGTYVLRAEIAETDNYLGDVVYTTFKIAKADITPAVTVEGWTYGEDANEPVVTGNDGNGEVTYTYAVKDSDEFTAEVPENAGEYTVKAVIAESANYNGSECTADFTISMADIAPEVTIEGWTYGEDANEPVVTGNDGNGEVTVTYAVKGSDEFTAEVPENAGEYTVKAVIAATDNYNGAEATADFTIAKADITPVIAIEGWTYGEEANEPEVTGNTGEGEVTVTYAVKGSDEFTADVPTNAGEYTVKAVIAATDNYNGAEATADFTITKADPKMAEDGDYNVVAQNLVFNNELQNLVTEYVKEGSGLVVRYSFYPEGMNPQIAGNIPRAKDVGQYPVYYMVEGNDNYNDVPWQEVPLTATIEKDTFEVSINGWSYGAYDAEANAPVATANFTDYEKINYTYAVKGSDEFTADVPVNVGEYTVKASIESANAYYSSLTATADFSIVKGDITPVVTIEGWTYGEEANEPEVTGNTGEGEVTFTYAAKDSDEFTEEVPTDAGEYTVKAVIAETDSYNSAEATADFTIAKADFTPTVTIEGWTYGEEANEPEVTGNTGEGEVTFTYAAKGSDEFTADVPTDAGEYTVKAVIAETDNYNSAEATADFTIAKADITPVVTVEGWAYGEYDEAVNGPSVSGNPENGDVTYQYKVKGADDETYADERPENTGEYTVKAVVEATANYNGAEAVADFTIVKAAIEPEIILDDWSYSEEPNDPSINEGGNPGNGAVEYTYAFKGSNAYSEIKPELPGNYTVKAVIADTDNYLGTTVYKDFIIRKGTFEPTVTLESWTLGEEANTPEVTGNVSEGSVKFTYAPKGSDAFSAAVPSAVGEYVVKATIAATDYYEAVEATADFAIVLLGDANNDGRVNVHDVTAIQRHIAECEILTGVALLAADVDCNGVVDINDATLLQMYLAEFDVTLGKQV